MGEVGKVYTEREKWMHKQIGLAVRFICENMTTYSDIYSVMSAEGIKVK